MIIDEVSAGEPSAAALRGTVAACRALIESRFPDESEQGAAAALLADGTILTGTSPDYANAAVTVCHETEPCCAAHRLNKRIVASVCLHRTGGGEFVVLSPCGVCRERLAMYGPRVRVAVPGEKDATSIRWVSLRDVLPHYWATVFPGEAPGWEE